MNGTEWSQNCWINKILRVKLGQHPPPHPALVSELCCTFFRKFIVFFSELCDQITVYISKNLQQNFWERKWPPPPPPKFSVVPNVRSWLRQRRKDGDLVTVSHLLPQSFHKSAPRASAAAHQIHIWGNPSKGSSFKDSNIKIEVFGVNLFSGSQMGNLVQTPFTQISNRCQ